MEHIVVIIDDGINVERSNNETLEFNLEVLDNFLVVDALKHTYRGVHGSICISIMKSIYPKIKIGSIKIFDDDIYTDILKLRVALEWCFKQQIKLIHLSVGSIDMKDYFVLEPIIKKLIKNNTIIVEAMDNRNQYTIPACFSGVIGVSHIDHKVYYEGISNLQDRPNIYSSSMSELVPKYQSPSSNSFAAPMITAHIANYLAEYGSDYKVKQLLYCLSFKYIVEETYSCVQSDFLSEPVIVKKADDKQNRFFGKVEIHLNDADTKLSQFETLVILENCLSDRENLYSFLRDNKVKITGIVFAGARDAMLYQLIKTEIGCLYYDESSLNEYINDDKVDNSLLSDVPVILFFIDQKNWKKTIEIANRLQSVFQFRGYAMQLISTFKYSYLDRCDFCHDFTQVKKLLCDAYQFGKYDLRLIITDDVICQNEYMDVQIIFGEVMSIERDKNIVKIPLSFDDSHFFDLVKFLLNHLE